MPLIEELNLTGFTSDREDLDEILRVDKDLWVKEMQARREHLEQFKNLPQEIWEAHERVATAVENAE